MAWTSTTAQGDSTASTHSTWTYTSNDAYFSTASTRPVKVCPVCNADHFGWHIFSTWRKACSLALERARGLVPVARHLFPTLLKYGPAPLKTAPPPRLPYQPPPANTVRKHRTLYPRTPRPSIKSRLRREWRPKGRRGCA